MSCKLGVNIDHIATIREARKIDEPDPIHAAVIAELAGAHGITVHLRGDRRHIKERDVEILKEIVKTRLNIEMAATEEMKNIALRVKPHMVTLVPENPGEVTTTGGLDVVGNEEKIRNFITALADEGIKASIFIDPVMEQIEKSFEIGCRTIEINTARYSDLTPIDLENCGRESKEEYEIIKEVAEKSYKMGIEVLAGHGLNYRNVTPIAKIEYISELNIGHSIIARASLVGLERAVREMLELLN